MYTDPEFGAALESFANERRKLLKTLAELDEASWARKGTFTGTSPRERDQTVLSYAEMKFICSIIVVEDIARSRRLYETILGQKVIADFGEFNVAFEGGLAFYKNGLYQTLLGGEKEILSRANNFELYFETDDLLEIEAEIDRNGFEFIHRIKEEPWKQRVFRFYDEDQNNVVIAERMEIVSRRLFKEHKTIEEIARLTGLPVEEISRHLREVPL